MMQPEVLDLTNEQPAEDRLIALPQRSFPAAEADAASPGPEIVREGMRGFIASILVLALFLVLYLSMQYVSQMSENLDQLTMDDLITLLQGIGSALLTPLVGLIGAVTGFYYGGQATAQTAAQTAARMSNGGQTTGSR